MPDRLYIDKGDVELKSHALRDAGIMAVRQRDLLTVWSDDGEFHYGDLNAVADVDDCIALKRAYERGRDAGVRIGRGQLQRELKNLLDAK